VGGLDLSFDDDDEAALFCGYQGDNVLLTHSRLPSASSASSEIDSEPLSRKTAEDAGDAEDCLPATR